MKMERETLALIRLLDKDLSKDSVVFPNSKT